MEGGLEEVRERWRDGEMEGGKVMRRGKDVWRKGGGDREGSITLEGSSLERVGISFPASLAPLLCPPTISFSFFFLLSFPLRAGV